MGFLRTSIKIKIMKATPGKSADQISKNDTEEIILDLQHKFDLAELHGDKEALKDLLSDDFISIGPKGFLLDKSNWIGRHDQFKYGKLETSDTDIHLYDKAAIIRNIQRNEASYKNEPVKVAVRVSQLWVSQNNQWKLAGIQFSPLPEN
jgi:hypothetical protein